jgi:capsular exopolysaccharide synthesis family protein
MSRIHEALKKAEQERVENPASVVPSIDEIPVMSPASANGTQVAAVRAPQRVAVEAIDADAFTHANLVLQCTKPEWKPDPSSILFLNNETQHGIGMEEFRTLRSRLYRMRERTPLKTILVGSALPAEGKSFVSANLAQILSRQQGRRVLLIDGDLRAPRLHQYLGAPISPGLTDYLKGEVNEFQILQQSPSENLFFIPGGTTMSAPAELLANGKMEMLLERMKPIFDWIIVDSSPILPVSDAGLLSQSCDGILLVVLSAKTPVEMAKRACKEFKGRPLLGVVLNRSTARNGGYGAYAYYGRYAKAYGDQEKQLKKAKKS